ncbi:MAG: glycoside hydrolase family 5 protein [Trueperaceae bacterium]|nr:glycoside hydrolase family 5 protein [Trueperaceae bacterium]
MKKGLLLVILLGSGLCFAQDIFERNQNLGRGVNLGNALEAPNEGEWGMVLEPQFFSLIKAAGFDSVRLPVSWTNHAAREAPFTVDAAFMDRIVWAVEEALKNDLNIIVNIHHYDELNADPVAEAERFKAIWRQIAERFQDYPEAVYFELLNEPHDEFNTHFEYWNQILAEMITVIRETNPARAIIVGPVNYNSVGSLDRLELPNDPNLIVTIHFYEPFAFTHQGAEWVSPSPPTGVLWTGGNRRLSSRWQNQSQETSLGFIKEGLDEYWQVEFAGADSFVKLHSIMGPRGYNALALKAKSDVELRVSCNLESDLEVLVQLQADVETVVPLKDCGDPVALKDVILKNASGAEQSFLLETLEFRGEAGFLTPFQDQGTELAETLQKAYEWGQKENRPIFLGEFGAYSKADLESRLRWTSFIRREAEKLGFSWAYWEFGAGFGIYDREVSVWRQNLLDALIQP